MAGMRFSAYQELPVELHDDLPARDAALGIVVERIVAEVTAGGYEVTSEVTFNGPSWFAFYLDLDGEPHKTPLSSRDPDPRAFPCPRCRRLSFKRCVTPNGKTYSRFHKARYPSVHAGYLASAETSREN